MATDSTGQIIRASKGAERVGSWLNGHLDQFALVVPGGHAGALKLSRVFMSEIQRVPGLLKCTPASLMTGFIHASQCGLEIGSHLGQAWLVPFKNKGRHEATLILGYKGLVAMAYRSGMVQNVQAFDVRKADDFKPPMLGTDPKILHSPSPDRQDSEVVAAYAVVRLRGSNFPNIEWLWRGECDAVMARSRAAASGSSPWHTDYPMMARKTALRRACKYIPQTAETRLLHTAVTVDEQADSNVPQAFDVPEQLHAAVVESFDPSTGELSPEEEQRMEADMRGEQ
jgi:recombination protein RecT